MKQVKWNQEAGKELGGRQDGSDWEQLSL